MLVFACRIVLIVKSNGRPVVGKVMVAMLVTSAIALERKSADMVLRQCTYTPVQPLTVV